MPVNILLSFTGFHDPYTKTAVVGEEQRGPILTALTAREFDRVILFGTPRTLAITDATAEALKSIAPEVTVEVVALPLQDPTDYTQIIVNLRARCGEIVERFPTAKLYVSTASGTPQMHACWLLLAASGELPARLLHTRPPQFVSDEKPMVSEVDVLGTPFPKVVPVASGIDFGAAAFQPGPNLNDVLEEIGIVAEHPRMRFALETARSCAEYDCPVLITGETGTGKDLFAKLIHRLSSRSAQPFVVVNCSAIPENLVESTLFGHLRGSFTGAVKDQKGKFEVADGGTLFLDEIGELPLSTQAKLLLIIESGMMDRVGSETPKHVDVRIVAATNRRLGEEIGAKRFREDLFFRLNTAEISLPPLRERRSDVPRIAARMLDGMNRNSRRQRQFSPDALGKLQNYDWPGNVRDLQTVVRRAVMFSGGKEILEAEDIRFDETLRLDSLAHLPEPHVGFDLKRYQADVRTRLIKKALQMTANNQTQAARLLGITPQAISNYLNEPNDEPATR